MIPASVICGFPPDHTLVCKERLAGRCRGRQLPGQLPVDAASARIAHGCCWLSAVSPVFDSNGRGRMQTMCPVRRGESATRLVWRGSQGAVSVIFEIAVVCASGILSGCVAKNHRRPRRCGRHVSERQQGVSGALLKRCKMSTWNRLARASPLKYNALNTKGRCRKVSACASGQIGASWRELARMIH